MKTKIVKNPDELQIITNPHKPTTKPMAKTKKAIGEFSGQAVTAAYILGGQAIAATGNAAVIPALLGRQNATIQQIARVLIPAVTGITLAASKNSHLQQLSLGMGVQSTLEAIKFIMPGFSPQAGLLEDSTFVFTDRNGIKSAIKVTPQGTLLLPDGREVDIPVNGKKSAPVSQNNADAEALDDSSYLDDYEGEFEWY